MTSRTKLRKRLKERFVELHQDIFHRILIDGKEQWLTEDGRKVVELARKKIGYKPSYINQDLFRSLMHTYKEFLKQK